MYSEPVGGVQFTLITSSTYPGMYSKVKFQKHLSDDPKDEDVELPEPAEEKTHIWQLEVSLQIQVSLSK